MLDRGAEQIADERDGGNGADDGVKSEREFERKARRVRTA